MKYLLVWAQLSPLCCGAGTDFYQMWFLLEFTETHYLIYTAL